MQKMVVKYFEIKFEDLSKSCTYVWTISKVSNERLTRLFYRVEKIYIVKSLPKNNKILSKSKQKETMPKKIMKV